MPKSLLKYLMSKFESKQLLTSLPLVSPFSNHSTEMLLVSGFILDTTAL